MRMKTKLNINRLNNTNPAPAFPRPRHGKLQRTTALIGAAVAGVLLTAQAAQAGGIFVIAMENHNFTQPTSQASPQPVFGNPAAPYQNSLITPGHPNAVQVSYATACFNAGKNVHPSEPNYIWAEAGTDFGFHSDADPKPSNGNIFDVPHLTAQLNVAGISWKNYQEDVQLAASPTNSAAVLRRHARPERLSARAIL